MGGPIELLDLHRQEDVGEHGAPIEQHVALEHVATLPTARLTGAPPTTIDPVVGAISPEMSISKVLFPQPLGPTTDTNSPAAMESSISARACTSPPRAVA